MLASQAPRVSLARPMSNSNSAAEDRQMPSEVDLQQLLALGIALQSELRFSENRAATQLCLTKLLKPPQLTDSIAHCEVLGTLRQLGYGGQLQAEVSARGLYVDAVLTPSTTASLPLKQ